MKKIKNFNEITKTKLKLPAEGFYDKYPFFSLKYIDSTSKKFSYKFLSNVQLVNIILSLNVFSQKTWKDIKNTSDYYRFHPVDKNKIETILRNINLTQEEKDTLECYQFKPFPNDKKLRIFGFFNEHYAFEILWFDKNHEIYNSK